MIVWSRAVQILSPIVLLSAAVLLLYMHAVSRDVAGGLRSLNETAVCQGNASALVFISHSSGTPQEYYMELTNTLVPVVRALRASFPHLEHAPDIVLLCDDETRYLIMTNHLAALFTAVLVVPPLPAGSLLPHNHGKVVALMHVFERWRCAVLMDHNCRHTPCMEP